MKLRDKPDDNLDKSGKKDSRFLMPLAEGIAALAISAAIGCAHTQERTYEPPRGSIALYSVEDGIAPEQVNIGGELNALIRVDMRIVRNGVMRDLATHEGKYGESGLTYCWFIFQATENGLNNGPGFLLLNPKYKDAGQPRFIGAILEYPGGGGGTVAAVLPVWHFQGAPEESGWMMGRMPASRNGYLFYLEGKTFVPKLDNTAILRLPDYCKETVLPEYAVVEFGPTFPVLAVYPSRE
jgi:hypothetical protein